MLAELITEKPHRAPQSLHQRDPRPPTQSCKPAHIQLFLRGAIGFAGIPEDLAGEARCSGHSFGELADRQIHAGAHIEELLIVGPWLPVLQGKHAGLAQIIHMQELAQGGTAAPTGHAGVAALGRFVETTDQGWQHVAVGGVVVVARAIQVGGHQADGIKAVLPAQRLTQLDAGDLGDRVPLIGGLERAGEQRFLANRLLGELGVDAAAAKKQQAPHPGAPGRFDHVGLDLEVVEQEISRVAVVGLDAAHLGRRQHHHRGRVLAEPTLHILAVFQIQLGAAGREQVAVARPLQSPADGAARHAAVAGHEDAVFRGDQAIHQLIPPGWSTSGLSWFSMDPRSMAERVVNVHEAKTHFSRLIDAAHAGETILVAKGGKPWARLVPLEQPRPRRQAGVLAGSITLPAPELLLEPLPEEELAAFEQPLF